nr:hypothetical protein [Tanacetum cinerariifolium]
MCSQLLLPSLSPPSAKIMIMALKEYGYQSRRGIRVPKKWRSSYSGDVILKKRMISRNIGLTSLMSNAKSPPSAKIMIMALKEYGYQSRRGIRVPKKLRSSYSGMESCELMIDLQSIRDPESINF